MPRGFRIDPLPSALTASKSAAYVEDEDCLSQCVHVHVGFVPANLTCRDQARTPFWRMLASVIGLKGAFTLVIF
jgi:hypothetical protein